MIKYKTLKFQDIKLINWDRISSQRKKEPLCIIWNDESFFNTINKEYTIPSSSFDVGCCFHRDNGPAIIHTSVIKQWFYYGTYTSSEESFNNSIWRRKIEIKYFL